MRNMPEQSNKRLELRVIASGCRDSFSKLIAQEEYQNLESVVHLIHITDKNHSPMLLWDVMNKKDLFLTHTEIWELIIQVWINTENNNWGLNQEFWGNMLTRFPPIDSMRGDIPKEFTCYRGGYKGGFSFTLDKEKAIWFRDRWGANPEHNLFERKTNRDDVLFYSDSREEKEVVIFPHKAKWDLVEIG